jgi:hypothetical protein
VQAFGRNVERIAEGVYAAAELDGAAQCLAGDLRIFHAAMLRGFVPDP